MTWRRPTRGRPVSLCKRTPVTGRTSGTCGRSRRTVNIASVGAYKGALGLTYSDALGHNYTVLASKYGTKISDGMAMPYRPFIDRATGEEMTYLIEQRWSGRMFTILEREVPQHREL